MQDRWPLRERVAGSLTPPACDAAAASASRSFRSSRTTARERRRINLRARGARPARVYVYKDGGTHALVAEAREDLERGPA